MQLFVVLRKISKEKKVMKQDIQRIMLAAAKPLFLIFILYMLKIVAVSYTHLIYLWYSSYFGDSLTACRLSIYELNKRLNEEEAYYTNINPEDYYKQSDLLGTKAYTAEMCIRDRSMTTTTAALSSMRVVYWKP